MEQRGDPVAVTPEGGGGAGAVRRRLRRRQAEPVDPAPRGGAPVHELRASDRRAWTGGCRSPSRDGRSVRGRWEAPRGTPFSPKVRFRQSVGSIGPSPTGPGELEDPRPGELVLRQVAGGQACRHPPPVRDVPGRDQDHDRPVGRPPGAAGPPRGRRRRGARCPGGRRPAATPRRRPRRRCRSRPRPRRRCRRPPGCGAPARGSAGRRRRGALAPSQDAHPRIRASPEDGA